MHQLYFSPIEKIKNKIKNIKKGSFTEDLKSTWLYGEIGELVENVNDMSHELKKYYDKEEINKDEFVEKQKVMELANQQIKSKNYQLNDTIVTLNSINVLVEELISIKDTKELMETVLPSTIKLVNASKGFIIEFLPEENYFQVMTSVNMEKINDGDKITFNDGVYLKKVFETRNYVNVDKISKIKDEGFETALIFPLMVEKEVKGVMYILNKKSEKENEKYFIESDESTVRTLSKLVAAVWESIHLFELASIDSLSKLYVRRYFEKVLKKK
ncbi:MAG: GAF domain-containing protein [Candidatus Sericytochromatia bacterium]